MMDFLQNLLKRHQVGTANFEAGHLQARHAVQPLVQPRLQSRFENDSGNSDKFVEQAHSNTEIGLTPIQTAHQNESLLTVGTAAPQNPPPPIRPGTPHGETEPVYGREEAINERINALALLFEQQTVFEQKPSERKPSKNKSTGRELPAGAIPATTVANQSVQPAQQQTEPLRAFRPEDARHTNSQTQAEVANTLEQSLQAILQALNPQQLQAGVNQTLVEARQHITSLNAAQDTSKADELNQRIQTVLHRLNNQPVHADEHQIPVKRRENLLLPTTGDKDHTSLQEQTLSSEPASAAMKKGTENRQSIDAQPQLEQSGLLQIPNWLAEIQAEFNNRWREIHKQVESESVINVSIGRVEVRAVQEKPAKQTEDRKKPSGVMTLDDYLKQRDHRGRA